MLLSNLAEPNWISVPCEQKLLHFIFCSFEENVFKVKRNISMEEYICNLESIIVKNKCFMFVWYKKDVSKRACRKGILIKQFRWFYHIFNAVSSGNSIPEIVIQNGTGVTIIKVQHYFNRLTFKYYSSTNSTIKGYEIFNAVKTRINDGINIFTCSHGGYILSEYVCDEFPDCPNDKSDEDFCVCKTNVSKTFQRNFCKEIFEPKKKTVCYSNYYMNFDGSCNKFNKLSSGGVVDLSITPYQNSLSGNTTFEKCTHTEPLNNKIICCQNNQIACNVNGVFLLL